MNWNKRVFSERRKSHFRGSRFQNFPGEDTPGPPYKCEVLCMHKSAQELDPPLHRAAVEFQGWRFNSCWHVCNCISLQLLSDSSKFGISSIAVRHDADLTDRISTVNKQLQELCVKNGFDFINNSNVDNTCLNGSQLHLNAKGSAFLATNFIK